ncbi:DUF3472 domain-containing protein [Flavivirga spongiicola]|uniref:DUF3472 domain-containing protein n=1 Tax=Flavivirga spongiicola TaxID=421621 RepID=A0ABU7XN31_9FLAO|nr:DUF3472 domain-containing protein [Flavivirga sp. MEBiC05379]MDO5981818.1 DUF3472 domain-containing protein [Flavivirga sp. MEBiC05379]
MKNIITKLNLRNTILVFILLINISFSCSSCSKSDTSESKEVEKEEEEETLSLTKTIPIGANSWVMNNLTQDQNIISESGIQNWSSLDDVIRTYVKTGAGELNVGLKMKSSDGSSKIKVTVGNTSKEITSSSTTYKTEEIGTFTVPAGYNYVEIKGLEKSGDYIVDISDILFGGVAIASGVTFNPTSNFYFGRRGPSVHMGYDEPSGKDVQWFYNEVTVPEGDDKIGSFFMANGHAQGYFGIQVNSATERRVLFSIWSAFSTDDPNQIPEDYKVTNLGNGTGVTVQDFGNEGSGIQCFKDVDWKAGVTYKFLLKGEPSTIPESTDYTAYFFDPEIGDWQLIAGLRRPKTNTHLKRLHSFLENFNPSTGYLSRRVNYGNQWVYTTDNAWAEMTSGTFTADATASNGDRLDYEGGTNGNTFFLKNCGFFNANVQPNTAFSRTASGASPNIDFNSLETPKLPDPPTPVTLLDRSSWSVIDYSTQEDKGGEGDTGRAADVLDDNLDTYWHSCWSGCTATSPHHITIDMGAQTEVLGIRFAQRQSLSRTVKNIEIQVSTDNSSWSSLGNFELQNIKEVQDVNFTSAQTFRYLKFISTSSHDGTENAAMAEIKAYIIE